MEIKIYVNDRIGARFTLLSDEKKKGIRLKMKTLVHQHNGSVGSIVNAIAVELALGIEAGMEIFAHLGCVSDDSVGRASTVDG